MSQKDNDLKDAREAYFAAGGSECEECDDTTDNPTWYWRRAFRIVTRERDAYRKAKQENDERFMTERDLARQRASRAENLCVLLAASLSRAIYEDTVLDENELTEGLPADWRVQVAAMHRRPA